MITPQEKPKPRTISKRKLPFKAPSPLLKRNNQKPLSFFTKRSSSTLEEKKKPLEFTSESNLNRSASQPDPVPLIRSKSALSAMTNTTSFGEVDEIDLTGDNEPVIRNFKQSSPPGSLIASAPSMKLNTLSGGKGQQMLDFGNKNLAPKRKWESTQSKPMNPWDGSQQMNKARNPRIKAESRRQTGNYYDSNSGFASSGNQFQRITLSDEQKHVLDLVVKGGKNVFYTGSAGTGKSVLLREIVAALRRKYGKNAVAVTASTGLAAVNIGGQTINRFSYMGIGDRSASTYIGMIKKRKEIQENWRTTKVLIIDEISMLDGRFLDKLDQVARGVRYSNGDQPFGGLQLVLTGDFFQLPPVPDRQTNRMEFCFQSKAWKCIHHTILLHQVFRQADPEFVDILNAIRVAEINDIIASKLSALSREVKYDDGIQPTELYATRYEVENSNHRRLGQLPGKAHDFIADDRSAKNERDLKMLESTMAVKKLTLKEDAQVMMLKNVDETLVNGSVGKVLAFTTEGVYSKYKAALNASQVCDEETVSEIRTISKCIGCSEISEDVLREINKRPLSRHEALIEIAQAALKEIERPMPLIKFSMPNGGFRVDLVTPVDFPIELGEREDAVARTQLPLLLSWALSIHKSQGQTLDRVKVDLQRVFEAGQVYVALSRAVSKERLQIANFAHSKIRCNPDVKAFYENLERF